MSVVGGGVGISTEVGGWMCGDGGLINFDLWTLKSFYGSNREESFVQRLINTERGR